MSCEVAAAVPVSPRDDELVHPLQLRFTARLTTDFGGHLEVVVCGEGG